MLLAVVGLALLLRDATGQFQNIVQYSDDWCTKPVSFSSSFIPKCQLPVSSCADRTRLLGCSDEPLARPLGPMNSSIALFQSEYCKASTLYSLTYLERAVCLSANPGFTQMLTCLPGTDNVTLTIWRSPSCLGEPYAALAFLKCASYGIGGASAVCG